MNLQRKRLRLMRDTQWRGYARTAEGNPITLSQVRSMVNLSVLGNSTQDGTPSPDNPVEVVGSGVRTGNLFDISKIEDTALISKHGNDITITNYTVSTNFTPELLLEMTGLSQGDTITTSRKVKIIDGTGNNITGRISFIRKDKASTFVIIDGTDSFRTTVIPDDFDSDNYNTAVFYGVNTGDTRTVIFSEVQILKGEYTSETLPPYEPYGYKVAVQASGRNLFDINSIISNNNITNNGNEIVINAKRVYSNLKPSEFMEMTGLKPGDKFTSRCKTNVTAGTDGSACRIIFINNSSGAAVYIFYGYSVKTISIPADFSDNKYSTLVFDGVENGDSTFANLMVFKGAYTADTLPPYESYKPPQTFNVYMSKPLHGVGAAHDTVLLNFDKRKAELVKAIGFTQLKSNDNWNDIFFPTIFKRLDPTIKGNLYAMCNYMPYANNVVATVQGSNVAGTAIAVYRANTIDGVSNLDSFKAWLSDRDVYAYYPLATPTATDITSLQDWDSLPDIKGTWILAASGGTEPTLVAEYYSNERSRE